MQEIACLCDGKQMKPFTAEMPISVHQTRPSQHANADALYRQWPAKHPKPYSLHLLSSNVLCSNSQRYIWSMRHGDAFET